MATTSDPTVFVKNLKRRGGEITKNAAKLVRQAALRCDQVVVLETKVDTGRARAGWVASINAPVFHDAGQGRSSGFSEVQPNATKLSLIAAEVSIAAYNPGDSAIFISNVVPYIGYLNFGSDVHEPGEMMLHGVLAAAAVIKGGRLLGP